MVRPDVSRPRSFRVDLTASVPPSGLFVADFAKAVSLPNSSASVLSECRNVYAMISDSVAELTEDKGVSPDGAVFAVTSPVTATPFDWSSSANFVATSLAACWDSSGYPAESSGSAGAGVSAVYWRPPSIAIDETGVK